MDESAIPQNTNNLRAEKGPGCDVRHRLAVSQPQFGTITMAMTPGREIQLSARVSF